MRKIDSHNHPDWYWGNFDAFLRDMDEKGIDRTWLLSWECAEHEYAFDTRRVFPAGVLGSATGPIPFSRCLSFAERAPERFILGYCPDPRLPDACHRLEAAKTIYNIQVCGELKVRMMYDSPDAIMLFRLAGELKLPVVFHLQYNLRNNWREPWCEWWGGTIDTIERVLQLCPETIFLGHAPGFWIHLSGDELYKKSNYPEPRNAPIVPNGRLIELLRRYPNLYCDISAGSGCMALARDPAFTREFLIEFHDRVLYARDYFDNQHQQLLDSLKLPELVAKEIYHANAERLLAL